MATKNSKSTGYETIELTRKNGDYVSITSNNGKAIDVRENYKGIGSHRITQLEGKNTQNVIDLFLSWDWNLS